MDIERCFEIFELDRRASPEEVKQAYKDTVNVWHPDRFSNNPRLKQKAEEKLKEVNVAYETLKSHLSSEQWAEAEKSEAKAETGVVEQKEANQKPQPEVEPFDKTEAIVEAGTGIILSLWSYLSSVFQRIAADVKTETKQGEMNQWQRNADGRGRGVRTGKGRGRRMGKGSGRKGRGRG